MSFGAGPDADGAADADKGVLAVDSGGSGLRVALGSAGRGAFGRRLSTVPVRTGPHGIDPVHLMKQLVPLVRSLTA
ncbi:ATPase, partial [Streptomyces sp. NPDC002491]